MQRIVLGWNKAALLHRRATTNIGLQTPRKHALPKLPVTAVRTSLSIWYLSFWSIGRIFSRTFEPREKKSEQRTNDWFYICTVVVLFWLWRSCSGLHCLWCSVLLFWGWSDESGLEGRRAGGDTEGRGKTNPEEGPCSLNRQHQDRCS